MYTHVGTTLLNEMNHCMTIQYTIEFFNMYKTTLPIGKDPMGNVD